MASNMKKRIGARVRSARTMRSMTQEQLAERIARTVEALSNIERGVSLPRIETLERLSRHLTLPLKDFFDDPDGHRAGSSRRAALELQLRLLLRELSDKDLEIAVGQVALLSKARQRA